jgi:hypothetical protein
MGSAGPVIGIVFGMGLFAYGFYNRKHGIGWLRFAGVAACIFFAVQLLGLQKTSLGVTLTLVASALGVAASYAGWKALRARQNT